MLNISVTDGVFTSYTRLDIGVSPVNDHSPVFLRDRYDALVRGYLLPAVQGQLRRTGERALVASCARTVTTHW